MRTKDPKLIPVHEYWAKNQETKQHLNRRGFPVSLGYLYRLIRRHKAGEKVSLPFSYKEEGQNIFIVSPN